MQFWLRARCALNAALSWWNGFQSLGLLYQLKRVPLDCGCKPKKSPIFFWTSWYVLEPDGSFEMRCAPSCQDCHSGPGPLDPGALPFC